MTQEDKELLLKDLCARLPYGVICRFTDTFDGCEVDNVLHPDDITDMFRHRSHWDSRIDVKPYLRPMSSMTEEEARDIAILHGNEPVDILSIKVTNEYIDIILDDGSCSTVTSTIWYDEIISSVKCFDWLNKKMFDYRGLIPKEHAIAVTEENNPYKD